MSSETRVNSRNGHTRTPFRQAARSAGDLWAHALTLLELQWKLLLVESSEGLRRIRVATLLVILGAFIGVMALPIGLCSLAFVLVDVWQFSHAAAFGLVTLGTIVFSLGLLAAGWRYFRTKYVGIPNSRQQARLNWLWLKETMRPAPHSDPHFSSPVKPK